MFQKSPRQDSSLLALSEEQHCMADSGSEGWKKGSSWPIGEKNQFNRVAKGVCIYPQSSLICHKAGIPSNFSNECA